jgi:hypothetical protein
MADEPVMTPDELQHLVPLGLNRISMAESIGFETRRHSFSSLNNASLKNAPIQR